MIACTISQFSVLPSQLDADLMSQHQLTGEEFEFLHIVRTYENRQNDSELRQLIERYERIFDNINVTRLVASKLVNYYHQIPPLRFNSSLLQPSPVEPPTTANENTQYPTSLPAPLSTFEPTSVTTPPIKQAQPIADSLSLDDTDDVALFGEELDPALQLASGRFG